MNDTTFLTQRFSSLWRFTDSSKQYAVSQDGRLWRAGYAPNKTTTGHKDALGFHSVNLSKGLEHSGRWYLHRLVYEVWVEPLRDDDVIHLDKNKSNNAVSNLSKIPHRQTLNKARQHDFKKPGLKNQSRLEAIRLLLKAGWSQKKIAEAFEISQPAISSYIKQVPSAE
jgi:DNA-binding CsgD family transcriptional regulator